MIAARRRTVVGATLVFALCACAYTALGVAVARVPPGGIDASAHVVAGEFPRMAWIFTSSCLWPTLTAFGLAGAMIAVRARAWRARMVFAISTTLVTWQISNALKDVFARPRPDYWIVHRETTFSYSSGHAMFAVLVYWLWAFYFARSDYPRAVRWIVAAALTLWGAGVIWSRLALGAHYPSDLAGGVLLAAAMLALATLVACTVAPRARIA